jgi:hypothetical protein
MGFELNGIAVFHPAALTLFDLVLARGSDSRLPLPDKEHGLGLPKGWWLPQPWRYDPDNEALREGFFVQRPVEDWLARLGVPYPIPGSLGFEAEELYLGALLSLAGPPGVLMVNDGSFGGVIDREHAVAFVEGRVVYAAGMECVRGGGSCELVDGAWRLECRGDPTTGAAAALLPAFAQLNLYNADYLPRNGERGIDAPAEEPLGDLAGRPRPVWATRGWREWFPVLGELDAL